MADFETVLLHFVAAVYSSDAASDPETWPEFSSPSSSGAGRDSDPPPLSPQHTSQALQTIFDEMSSFRSASKSSQLLPSAAVENQRHSATSALSPSDTDKSMRSRQLAMRLRGVMRRAVVARVVFKNVMQPVITNILQAAFRSGAQSVAKNIVESAANNADMVSTQQHQQQLSAVANALLPVSAIRCRHALLKLLFAHHEENTESAAASSSLHSVLCMFFKAAGFTLVYEQPEQQGDYTAAKWQWTAVPALLASSATKVDGGLCQAASQLLAALATLRDAEKLVLSRAEALFDRGGIFSSDRVAHLDYPPWLLPESAPQSPTTTTTTTASRTANEIPSLNQIAIFIAAEVGRESETQQALRLVGDVLSSRNEARQESQHKEAASRFEAAREQALVERQAQDREQERQREARSKMEAQHEAEVASVQHLMPRARQTLHETGRVRNSSFQGVAFRIQPLRVRTRIHLCDAKTCDTATGVEIHWHLRAAPNVLYAFTAHLSQDATKLVHLGDEIGYQYDTLPGSPYFRSTVMMNRKRVDDAGQLLSISHEVKVVDRCVCGIKFDELWE